ncbi:MAG: hypothetical protein ABW098_20440 [Candidatus Thiodiazotropha sp.]
MTTVPIRPSSYYLLLCLMLSAILFATLLDAVSVADTDLQRRAQIRHMVAEYGLTDPALFTEARYTRHISQADRHAPFQDHPMAFEHFPSGSLVLPADIGHRP